MPIWARNSRGERSESFREKDALVDRSGGRDLGVSNGPEGDCGGRSCWFLAVLGRCDARRGCTADLSADEGMRLVVGVVELEGRDEGDCRAEGEDMRLMRPMRERNLSWRVMESGWRCFGATSLAMLRNKSSDCWPSSDSSDELAMSCGGGGGGGLVRAEIWRESRDGGGFVCFVC